MTLIPLTYRNFVKNKVRNTIKVNYKNSDSLTYAYDNNIDSKSILNTENFNFSDSEINLSSNTQENKNKIRSFFNLANNLKKDRIDSSTYFGFKDTFINGQNNGVKNENIKLFNFKNSYKIDKVTQRFLPQSFELQKKNYVKYNLYRDYQKDYSLDYYNNLKFGFCNWNTINFFSQRFESNRNHTNCIVWPNTKTATKNQYDFIDKSFNLSFYLNKRKNYSANNKPECIFHIPDIISFYLIKTNSSTIDRYRVAIIAGNQSKNKLVSISGINLNSDNSQILLNSVYVSSALNIFNNRWYNLSLNYLKNQNNSRNIELYIDGVLSFNVDLTNVQHSVTETKNSYLCLGNRPNYQSNTDYEHVFYQMFARNFDKDISLGKNNQWQATGSEQLNTGDSNYTGNITFEKSVEQNSESFHGEIHDIRIYANTLQEEKITENCEKTITNLSNEVSEYNLQFYVPVYYVPSYSRRKSSFNASSEKINLKYSCLYNPIVANTCGALEVSCENYLIDFINHTKPNIIIGGAQAAYVYDDNITNSISTLIHSQNDVAKIKKGHLTQTIYNENLNNSSHSNRSINLDSNLSYRNLLILPNDNGIQKINFDVISEFLQNYNNYETNIVDNNNLYNVSIENIFKKDYFNRSWNLDVSKVDNVPDTVWPDMALQYIQVSINSEFLEYTPDLDYIYNFSNIIFHDERITNIEDLTTTNVTTNTRQNRLKQLSEEVYTITSSNPLLRNYKQNINSTSLDQSQTQSSDKLEYNNSNINYLKLPVPYSVFNVDYDSIFISIFDISSKLYNKKIKRNTFKLKNNNLDTSNNNLNLSFSDNSTGGVYRDDCLTKVADWNYVGHIFYKDGIISLNRPELFYFGVDDFECEFESDFSMFVHEINIPANKGLFDKSSNNSYDENLRQDESAFNSEESFVYITDINLHDENLNVVARAKLARPAPKKKSDSILFRLKMDY